MHSFLNNSQYCTVQYTIHYTVYSAVGFNQLFACRDYHGTAWQSFQGTYNLYEQEKLGSVLQRSKQLNLKHCEQQNFAVTFNSLNSKAWQWSLVSRQQCLAATYNMMHEQQSLAAIYNMMDEQQSLAAIYNMMEMDEQQSLARSTI